MGEREERDAAKRKKAERGKAIPRFEVTRFHQLRSSTNYPCVLTSNSF